MFFITFFIFGSCKPSSDITEIRCISDFVYSNSTQKQIDAFVELEDTEVMDGWGDLTGRLVGRESRNTLIKCNLDAYLLRNNHNIEELKGHYFFVHSVHSYLKKGFVDIENIDSLIDSYVSQGIIEK